MTNPSFSLRCLLLLATGCLLLPASVQGQESSGTTTNEPKQEQKPLGPVRIERFKLLEWSPETGGMQTRGRIRIIYTDPNTKEETTVTAEKLLYDETTDVIRAEGNVRLDRSDGNFTAKNAVYNLRTKVGQLEEASLRSLYFRMDGKRIETFEDSSVKLTDGEFSTCTEDRPDYSLSVRTLTIKPNDYLEARQVRLKLGNFALPPLPRTRRTFTRSFSFPYPTPGYSRTEGLTFRAIDTPVEQYGRSLEYDLRINFRRLPSGFVAYQFDLDKENQTQASAPPRRLIGALGNPIPGFLEEVNPPNYRQNVESGYLDFPEPRKTVYATISNLQLVVNRRRSDIAVTRIPEVGIQLFNVLGKKLTEQDREAYKRSQDARPGQGVGAASHERIPFTPALLNTTASLGQYIETPTSVSATRLSFRSSLATQPLRIGRLISLRAGFTNTTNLYSRGTIYNLFSPEVELNLTPTSTSLFNVAYRYSDDKGRTPFVFDRRDVRHELRLQYQVSGPWAFGIIASYDLERSRAYDTEVAIARNFDCVQVGLVYRTRSQSVNILFTLLPIRRERSRTSLMPLGVKRPQ